MSRAKTDVEVRTEFMAHLWEMVLLWENVKDRSLNERLSGVVGSVLAALDGVAGSLPVSFNITTNGSSPETIAEAKAEDRKWYPDGADLHAGGMLHDEFYEVGRKYGYFK